MDIARFIDHTILKPTTSKEDVENVCQEALQYHFAAVCIPPYFLDTAQKTLDGSAVKLATVVGFPFGYSHYKAKLAEIKQAIKANADEVDVVINIAAVKDKNFNYLKEEIKTLTHLTDDTIGIKLIIESGVLTNQEIIECCRLYQEYPVDFLKTSTGYADKGASISAVKLMRKHLPASIQIKASGGIKNYAVASQMIEAGATRLGCSASVAIVTGQPSHGTGF